MEKNEVFTAQQAGEFVQYANEAKRGFLPMEGIMSLIKKEAMKGRRNLHIHGKISPVHREELENLGYIVKERKNISFPYVMISW